MELFLRNKKKVLFREMEIRGVGGEQQNVIYTHGIFTQAVDVNVEMFLSSITRDLAQHPVPGGRSLHAF